MGREIDKQNFTSRDYQEFSDRLAHETKLLGQHFRGMPITGNGRKAGLELELWLIDKQFKPAAVNQQIIAALNEPLICPELAKFNIEINTEPLPLTGNALSQLANAMQCALDALQECAKDFSSSALMIGILPTATLSDFCLDNMSEQNRYRALNEQLLRSREGEPLTISMEGIERFKVQHRNVMLESAATSYQIHMKVPPRELSSHFNAALIASAPLVAVASNSPIFLGSELWEETRIPLFEQSTRFGNFHGTADSAVERVYFGDAYLRRSAFELFENNLEIFPILLPLCDDSPPEQLSHLRLHNGTIWRWNRILIDLDDNGKPGFRIEHRSTPAGPSIQDMVANTAFFYGLVHDMAESIDEFIPTLSFDAAKQNFYAAARYGLSAELDWPEKERISARRLILEKLLPAATRGLKAMNISSEEINHFLKIIEARAESGRTGAKWQRQVYQNNGHDLQALTQHYYERQQTKDPVHLWSL